MCFDQPRSEENITEQASGWCALTNVVAKRGFQVRPQAGVLWPTSGRIYDRMTTQDLSKEPLHEELSRPDPTPSVFTFAHC